MRGVFGLCMTLLLAIGWAIASAESPKPNNVSAFMQLKLEHTTKVLAGIAQEDFPAIQKHAQQLSLLSEDASWSVLETPDYLRFSRDFRRATDAMRAAAEAKNIDGATLAYVDMTLQCVHCHKHVRDVRMPHKEARLENLLQPTQFTADRGR